MLLVSTVFSPQGEPLTKICKIHSHAIMLVLFSSSNIFTDPCKTLIYLPTPCRVFL